MVDQPTADKKAKRMTADQLKRLLGAADRFDGEQARARARFRATLVELTEEGVSGAAIARGLGISRQAVHERLHRGDGPDRPKPSKVPK